MVQAAILDGLVFDAPPFSQDGFSATKVDVGRCQVADALVVAVVVVVFDECGDGGFKFPFEEVVFEQDAVFEGLMPPLDFALSLWMHWRAANMFHALVLKIFRQIASNVGRAIVAQAARCKGCGVKGSIVSTRIVFAVPE
jgi:hypothetical protein